MNRWLAGFVGISCFVGGLQGRSLEVETFVEEIKTLREQLALGVSGEVNADTFAAVCKPVGMKAKTVSQEKQWIFRQVSAKYRNPAHKPTAVETEAIRRFEQDPSLQAIWNYENGSAHYYRRITIQASCLACHGDKDSRPDFIKTQYPDDLAHGFKLGELRGIFSVTLNKKQEGLLPNTKMAHIGIVVKDIETALYNWMHLLGEDKRPNIILAAGHEANPTRYRGKPSTAKAKLAFLNLENIQVELIEPVGEEPSHWREFLETEGEGVHHVAFWVDGIGEVHLKNFEDAGLVPAQTGGWDGGEYAYMDSLESLGVVVELLENYKK